MPDGRTFPRDSAGVIIGEDSEDNAELERPRRSPPRALPQSSALFEQRPIALAALSAHRARQLQADRRGPNGKHRGWAIRARIPRR